MTQKNHMTAYFIEKKTIFLIINYTNQLERSIQMTIQSFIISSIIKMQNQSRQCRHAGDWYSNNPAKLNHEIHELLNKSHSDHHHYHRKIKAIIVPHGSLSSSGSTAAAAYKYLLGSQYQRIFIFGPIHNIFSSGCALTYMDKLQTPLGELQVDRDVVNYLKEQFYFRLIDIDKDQQEHSIQMQLPFIITIFDKIAKIIPIITGPFDEDMLNQYQKSFSTYFQDPNSLFIFSTDFCHWGDRYNYKFKDNQHSNIWESIQRLDHDGMKKIESHSYDTFKQYIHHTKNTICGRDSLEIFLKLVGNSKQKLKTKFIKYTQAQQINDHSDHLISYASAITYYQPQDV